MSEANTPPKLSVVDEPAEALPERPRRGARAVLPWLALAVALLFAWLWLNQLEATQRLERRVMMLEMDLSSAREDLAAWESHMRDVRSGIDGVASQIDALRALVSTTPGIDPGTDGAAPEAPANEPPPAPAPASEQGPPTPAE